MNQHEQEQEILDKAGLESQQTIFVVDWDGVCCEAVWPQWGEWIDGAVLGLKKLLTLGRVRIYSSRLNPYKFGLDGIELRDEREVEADIWVMRGMLDAAGLADVEIHTTHGKPTGHFYIDDRAVEFTGSWDDVLARVTPEPQPEIEEGVLSAYVSTTGYAPEDVFRRIETATDDEIVRAAYELGLSVIITTEDITIYAPDFVAGAERLDSHLDAKLREDVGFIPLRTEVASEPVSPLTDTDAQRLSERIAEMYRFDPNDLELVARDERAHGCVISNVTPPGLDFGPEWRATDEATGGAKGRKQAVFANVSLIADVLAARVHGFGVQKYPDDGSAPNWSKGMPWSWMYDAMRRHIAAYWSGEDINPESGLPHLAHARWMIDNLIEYAYYGMGADDRPAWREGTGPLAVALRRDAA